METAVGPDWYLKIVEEVDRVRRPEYDELFLEDDLRCREDHYTLSFKICPSASALKS
jgi:hypothetical protein